MIRIAVLVSGGGTNLQALLDAEASGALGCGSLVLVVADRDGTYALKRAQDARITGCVVHRVRGDRALFEARLEKVLTEHAIDLIIFAGFLSLLSEDFVRKYPLKILNIHPSLLPSFSGKGYYGLKVHQAALERGVTISGATVHFVNATPDGGPIVAQQAVPVLAGDSPVTLQRRIMEEAEWVLLPRCTKEVCQAMELSMNIEQVLKHKKYPGRGLIMGVSSGGCAVIAYFLMGRSNNSRNRILALEGETVKTEAFDSAALEDPSLIIYHPLRMFGSTVIVSNGDQTDTIESFLAEGKTFEEALETRYYEPDEPAYTPRISGLFEMGESPSYTLSIHKREEETCKREFFPYTVPRLGRGHLIHTYEDEGSALASFVGSPKEISLDQDMEQFSQSLWNSLDTDNRIALYVRYTDLNTGSFTQKLINKHTR